MQEKWDAKKGMSTMEEPTKYEVNKEKRTESELTAMRVIFQKAGRESVYFVIGDVVITKEGSLQKVGSSLSVEEAQKMLMNRSIKALYPIESYIEFL